MFRIRIRKDLPLLDLQHSDCGSGGNIEIVTNSQQYGTKLLQNLQLAWMYKILPIKSSKFFTSLFSCVVDPDPVGSA
jgi:hypothetical protein